MPKGWADGTFSTLLASEFRASVRRDVPISTSMTFGHLRSSLTHDGLMVRSATPDLSSPFPPTTSVPVWCNNPALDHPFRLITGQRTSINIYVASRMSPRPEALEAMMCPCPRDLEYTSARLGGPLETIKQTLFSIIVGAKPVPRRRLAVILRGRGRELAVEETHRAFMKRPTNDHSDCKGGATARG
jgi:hypothetical protein